MSERLGEMKNKVTGLTDSDGDFADVVKMKVDVYAWFYEQAERAEKLRWGFGEMKRVAEMHRSNEIRLEQQNKRYRDLFGRLLNSEIDDAEEYADLAEQTAWEALEGDEG